MARALVRTLPGQGLQPAGVVPPGARGGTGAGTGERGAEAHGSRCPLGRADAAQYKRHQLGPLEGKELHAAVVMAILLYRLRRWANSNGKTAASVPSRGAFGDVMGT